jgi:hypothetical protein
MAKAKKQEEVSEVEEVAATMELVKEGKALFGESHHLGMQAYLEGATDGEDLAADYATATDHAKAVFETASPTPDQVFWAFERFFGE